MLNILKTIKENKFEAALERFKKAHQILGFKPGIVYIKLKKRSWATFNYLTSFKRYLV